TAAPTTARRASAAVLDPERAIPIPEFVAALASERWCLQSGRREVDWEWCDDDSEAAEYSGHRAPPLRGASGVRPAVPDDDARCDRRERRPAVDREGPGCVTAVAAVDRQRLHPDAGRIRRHRRNAGGS